MSDGNRRRPTTRLALDVGPKARARLERISADAEKSLSEVVRDAVALYDLLLAEVQAGRRLVVRDPETGSEVEMLIPKL